MTTATTTEVKTATEQLEAIKPEIKTLAARIKELVELDVSTGLVPEKEKGSVYKEGLAQANVTMEEAERVHKAETTIVAAHQLAIGQIGVEAQSKHKDLGVVQGTIAMYGNNTFTSGINREGVSRNPKTGEASTVYGQTFNSYQLDTSANKGQMGKIRSGLKALATEAHNKSK